MSNQEPSNKEIMAVVGGVKENTEQILEAIGVFSNKVEERFGGIDDRFNSVDGRLDKVEGRLTKIEANMVTRDILDEKLTDLKADLTILMCKEDHKLAALVEL